MRDGPSRVYRAIKFVGLAVVCGAFGFFVSRFFVSRFLFPAVLKFNILFLLLPLLLVATLRFARALRRARLGS